MLRRVYSRLFLVALMAITALVSGAPGPGPTPIVHGLPAAKYDELAEIIAAEDNPGRIAEALGEHYQLEPSAHIAHLLTSMVHHNHVESFAVLYARIAWPRNDGDRWQRMIFRHAADLHRLEICDYLLSRPDFALQGLFAQLECPRYWEASLAHFRPDIAQLRELARRHPGRIPEMVPELRWFRSIDDAPIFVFLLDFIEHCRAISADFAANGNYNPSSILSLVLRNRLLGDARLAAVITHLAGMGARVPVEEWEGFGRAYPEHVQAQEALSGALIIEQEVKEPEFE
jgi:hypothetical protein